MRAAARAWCVSAVCASGALVAVLAALSVLAPGATTPGSLALSGLCLGAALTAGLAALTRVQVRALRPVHVRGTTGRADDAPPPGAGRATDPVHHPRRPRAPGQA